MTTLLAFEPTFGITSFLVAIPLLVPGLVVSIVIAIAAAPRIAQRLGTSSSVAGALLISLGLVLSATLTPDHAALFEGTASSLECDLSRLGLPPFRELTRVDDVSLNVALFVPLGLALGWLPPSRARLLLIGGCIALPFVIETLQLTVTALGRGCQSADVVDNLLGLGIGIAVASVFRIGRHHPR